VGFIVICEILTRFEGLLKVLGYGGGTGTDEEGEGGGGGQVE
jgi:hypothetical protein